MFLLPALVLVLHLALLQAANLNINFWEDEVESEKFGTWVLCVVCPISSYGGCFLKL
jgi:hypothetical protein